MSFLIKAPDLVSGGRGPLGLMRFPPAGRRRRRRQRRFTQAVENGSRLSSFLIQIFQSWHFYTWTVTDVQSVNKTIRSATVAGNFGCRRGKQMWKITFQIDQGKTETQKPRQASATAPWKGMWRTFHGFFMTLSQIFNPLKKKKEKRKKGKEEAL